MNFTNNNYNANEFAYKDESRLRGISLKGLIVILILVLVAFASIAEELNLEFGKEKYTIDEIEEMAEEYFEDAEDMGYSIYRAESYVIRRLEDAGIKVDRYNISIDRYGNVEVEAK